MNVTIDKKLAENCRCEFVVLAIRNQLEQGRIAVDILERRTGIILNDVQITRSQNESSTREWNDVSMAFVKVGDYSDVAFHSWSAGDKEVVEMNLAQAVVDALSSFIRQATEFVPI